MADRDGLWERERERVESVLSARLDDVWWILKYVSISMGALIDIILSNSLLPQHPKFLESSLGDF